MGGTIGLDEICDGWGGCADDAFVSDCADVGVDAAPPLPLPLSACAAAAGVVWAADFLLPLLLPELELLLSSAPDSAPFCCCSALTISCFASDVFVPGLVRLIFILSPLSSVAWWSMATLLPALPAPGPLAFDDIVPVAAGSLDVGDAFDLLPPIVGVDVDACFGDL